MIKRSSSLKPLVCDLTTIEQQIEMEKLQLEQEGAVGELFDMAFVGRSNVGKSSLINALLGVELTQTSKTPGKTKDLSFIPLAKPNCRLVDCPGYGFAKTSHVERDRWKKFMQIYLKESPSLQRLMLLVDLKVGLHESDRILMDTLTES